MMMKQSSFSEAEYAGKKRVTKRERFLTEMEKVVPWSRLVEAIEPHYPKGGLAQKHGATVQLVWSDQSGARQEAVAGKPWEHFVMSTQSAPGKTRKQGGLHALPPRDAQTWDGMPCDSIHQPR